LSEKTVFLRFRGPCGLVFATVLAYVTAPRQPDIAFNLVAMTASPFRFCSLLAAAALLLPASAAAQFMPQSSQPQQSAPSGFGQIPQQNAPSAFQSQQPQQQQRQQAAPPMGIAAVVNEDIITVYDVQSRLALFMATSGMENTQENQRRVIPQVIQSLIEERLKMQEAKRLEIAITEAEVRQAVDGIERQNGMEPGTFRKILEERGADLSSLFSQIEADVAWVKVVREDLARQVNVAPEEIKLVMDRLKNNQGRPEHLIAEIVLPVSAVLSDQDALQLGARLAQQARDGVPFPALAQQFSQSPTAAVGGDLGWVLEGELEDELDAAVARMQPGEVSEPIHTNSGYHVIVLRGRRDAGAPDPMMAAITMSQVYLPTVGGRAITEPRLSQLTASLSNQAMSCEQMNTIAKQVGTPGSGPVDALRVGVLPPKVRDAVVNLQPGRSSGPIEVAGARLFAVICQRMDDSGLPSEGEIAARLENEKLENIARLRLRDLRRQALVDVRL